MSLERLDTGEMVLNYNGVAWGPSTETVSFSVRPNPDPARRTVMSATYTVTVRETIADTDPTDPVLLAKIEKLTRPGGRLRYVGRGFGDLEINLAGDTQKDVSWGPWTKEIVCAPVGAGRAVELTWTFEVTTVNCADGLTAAGAVLAFSYTVEYAVDKDGYSTRNYEATLTIAQTRKRVDDKTLSATADAHRDKIVPAPLPGFRRESQSFRLSADKCTVTASVRDVQMPPNLPPAGVVDGSIEHSWQSLELFKWAGSFGATYDIARDDGDPFQAVEHFRDLALKRIGAAKKMVIDADAVAGIVAAGGGGGGFLGKFFGGAGAGRPVVVYLRGASASEPNVLGRTQVKLGIQYLAVGCSFSEILRSGGLWVPTDAVGTTLGRWARWSKTVPTLFSPRGQVGLRLDPKEDAIVDACVPGATPVTQGQQTSLANTPPGIFGSVASAGAAVLAGGAARSLFGAFPAPTAENSWIEYKCFSEIRSDTGRVLGSTLPTDPLTQQRSTGGAWDVTKGVPAGPPPNSSPFPPLDGITGRASGGGGAFVHQRTRPTLYVTISGYALRGGFDIPVPELVEVNGTAPVLVGTPVFRTGIAAHTQVPIVYATWSLTYAFVEEQGVTTRGIPTPPNPYL